MTWWVVQTEAQREHIVRVLLMRAKYETYIPRIKHRSRIAPLFPSYLFVRSADRWYPVRWTDHVVRLLMPAISRPTTRGNHGRASANARSVVSSNCPTPTRLRKGQHVRVIRGCFEGQLAVHQGMGSRERVWVLLNLMGQQVPVELPSGSWNHYPL